MNDFTGINKGVTPTPRPLILGKFRKIYDELEKIFTDIKENRGKGRHQNDLNVIMAKVNALATKDARKVAYLKLLIFALISYDTKDTITDARMFDTILQELQTRKNNTMTKFSNTTEKLSINAPESKKMFTGSIDTVVLADTLFGIILNNLKFEKQVKQRLEEITLQKTEEEIKTTLSPGNTPEIMAKKSKMKAEIAYRNLSKNQKREKDEFYARMKRVYGLEFDPRKLYDTTNYLTIEALSTRVGIVKDLLKRRQEILNNPSKYGFVEVLMDDKEELKLKAILEKELEKSNKATWTAMPSPPTSSTPGAKGAGTGMGGGKQTRKRRGGKAKKSKPSRKQKKRLL